MKTLLLLICIVLAPNVSIGAIQVLNSKTEFSNNGYSKTTIDIVDSADTSLERPSVHVDGKFMLKPAYDKKEKLETILYSKDKYFIAFTMKKATQSYRIGIVCLMKNGKFSVDLDAGNEMHAMLLKHGFEIGQERESMFISSIDGEVLTIVGLITHGSYCARFKVLDDGSYQLIKNSFKIDKN